MERSGSQHVSNKRVIKKGTVPVKAYIIRNGAVLLGRYVTCDAHVRRPVRVITHAHWDHILGFERSLKECEEVLMTQATRDMLGILRGERKISSPKVRTLTYSKSFSYKGEKITFYRAGHIFGAAQVLLQTKGGGRILYTGDFRLPEAQIIPTDILVMEATYGNPKNKRRFKADVESELISLIIDSLKTNSVWVLGYHGKLQEVLGLLHKAKVKNPVVLQDEIFRVARAFERRGLKFGKYYSATTKAGEKLIEGRTHFVALFHQRLEEMVPKDVIKITLSGWEFERPVRKISKNEYLVALSDHSDFEELIRYVNESKPRLVITDNYRAGDAQALAREIRRRLGIPAQPMP